MSINKVDAALKRTFDVIMSLAGLVLVGWLILLSYIIAAIDTRQSGFFMHERIGKNARPFRLIKIRTMRDIAGIRTDVTVDGDPRITAIGRLIRKAKIDELPQLINVLLGHMSFVGPRPDVPGFADKLEGDDRMILSVRPGITGPASLKYRNEETLLAAQADPEGFNRDVIYPDKVRINKEYIMNYSFIKDIKYIFKTVLGL